MCPKLDCWVALNPELILGPITDRLLAIQEYPSWMRSWSWRLTNVRWACWRCTILLGSTQLTHSDYYHMTSAHWDCVSCFTILLSLYQEVILSESRLCPGTSQAQNRLCPCLSPQLAAQSPMPSPPCLDQSVLGKESRQHFLLFSHTNDASALLTCWEICVIFFYGRSVSSKPWDPVSQYFITSWKEYNR